MRQIILDTETTGLSVEQGHRIIEIGCLELINRKLTGKHFHHYINPEREIDEGAKAVHGITEDFLKTKPTFAVIAKEFMEFISGAELIIHNAPFDIGFINAELQLIDKKGKPISHYCSIIDTLLLAKQLHLGQRNSLDALCKRYNIDNTHRDYHGALLDAHLLAQVYLIMTGGQGSLFGESIATESVVAEQTFSSTLEPISNRNLIVLQANTDELEAHQTYLEKLKKKNRCVWLD